MSSILHRRVAVLNVVGLCRRLLGPATPFLSRFAREHGISSVRPVLPAVTSTMQATYLTGKLPRDHGIVANYWYDRDYGEHRAWKQSDRLVDSPKVWEMLRERNPAFSCAKVFWWNNLYSSTDYSITPRPIYCADGKKVFDIQTWPMSLREEIKSDLGDFPFPAFWGPRAGLASSQWIAASAKWFERKFAPHLNLVYLPHLDYNLQRLGTDPASIESDLGEIDSIVEDLVGFFRERQIDPIILSEYGITPVTGPVWINREFRRRGWIVCREELGRDQLDPGNCGALAICDHQVAHVYVNRPSLSSEVAGVLAEMDGIARVYPADELSVVGLNHSRSGDFVIVAEEDRWFAYPFWLEDSRAPDFARCVDIHRKPGYDPAELFLDPAIRFPHLKVGWKLLRKKMGFRTLMDVIPLDAYLIRGSHGAIPASTLDYPVLMASGDEARDEENPLDATEVCAAIFRAATRPNCD